MRATVMAVVAAVLWCVFPHAATDVNTGPARWEGSVIYVDHLLYPAAQAWKVPGIQFVDSHIYNETPYGIQFAFTRPVGAGAAGEATPEVNDRGYITKCVVTLGNDGLTSDRATQEAIFVHEVGHCLGMEHVTGNTGEKSIMNPYLDTRFISTVTPWDTRVMHNLYAQGVWSSE